MPSRDPLYSQLAQLNIAEPSAQAQADILRAARQMPVQRRFGFLLPLKRLRATLYVPQTRYAIMASVVAIFIGLGALNQSLRTAPQIPDELMLYDLAFTDFDPATVWLDNDAS